MIIAKRELQVERAGAAVPLIIELHQPIQKGRAWKCDFVIHWPAKPHRGHAMGVDGVQALFLAMQMVGTLLYASQYHAAGQLKWSDGGGYGFPLRASARDLASGTDIDM